MVAKLRNYSKAIAAGLTAAIALVGGYLSDGITADEWVKLVGGLALIVVGVIAAPANQKAATDAAPVTVPVADASGTVVGQTVVTGPEATIAHYEPPSRLDQLDGVGEHRAPEPRADV